MSATGFAQDAVIITDGNIVRGTIKGADFATVQLLLDDQTVRVYKAKDIKEFLWNGDTYSSKPLLIKNKMESRFFKVEETGAVNLYSMGSTSAEKPKEKRIQVRPSVGVGIGSGGYGGVGFGGGITIGGGRRNSNKQEGKQTAVFYIEKPGTGPILEVPIAGRADKRIEQVRNVLLQKLGDDEDLAERLKEAEDFDARNVRAFVNAYNAMRK